MNPRAAAALLILPVLFLIAQTLLRNVGVPYWLWWNGDPSYAYLIDGIDLVRGLAPSFSDHPGTPVSCIVALVIWLLGGPAAAFDHAETVLSYASDIIFALDAAAMLLLGWTVWRRFGSLVPAVAAEAAPFATMLALRHGIDVKPEPLLLCATMLLAASMVEEAMAPRRASLAMLGAAAGFGIACKVTFAPFALTAVLLPLTWRRRALFVIAAAVALVVFFAPALPKLPHMLDLYAHVTVGSGAYGSGAPTVIDFRRYPVAFEKLFFARPIFFIVWLLGAAALVLARRERGASASAGARLLVASLAMQLVQIVFVAKHPDAHYALPAYEMSAPAIAFLWLVARELALVRERWRSFARDFALLLLAVGAAQAAATVRQGEELARASEGARKIDLARDFPRCAQIYRDLASSQSLAWYDNHFYSGGRYKDLLAARAPAGAYYSFSWGSGGFENWQGPAAASDIARQYPCVALRGTGLADLESLAARLGGGFGPTAICAAGDEYVVAEGAPCPAGTRYGR